MDIETILWSERFRPHKVADCILPPRIKTYFQAIADKKHLDNMTLVGPAGCGKTSLARALCEEMGIASLVINASESGNIDTVRTTVRQFASTVSFNGGIKCIILDEADGLTTNAQQALRGSIEEFAKNCRFILTGNFGNRIIEPILSRAPPVDFNIEKAEKGAMLIQFAKSIEANLVAMQIEYTPEELYSIIKRTFPDFRRTWNLLQRYCSSGRLIISSQQGIDDTSLKQLAEFLQQKKFGDMRKWVVENMDNDGAMLRRAIYDKLTPLMTPESIPQTILTLAEYDYKEAHVVDKEINMVAMLTMLMADCAWA